jgi:small subunit ribosomal protein S2
MIFSHKKKRGSVGILYSRKSPALAKNYIFEEKFLAKSIRISEVAAAAGGRPMNRSKYIIPGALVAYGGTTMGTYTARDLFDAGVHVGHQLRRWNPRSKPYVYGHRHGISIIDLEKTLRQLDKACAFLEHLVAGGGEVWFIGTKQQAQEIIREGAVEVGMPFCVARWLGGTLTNFPTIHRALQKYRRFLEMEQRGEIDSMPNKEASSLRRKMGHMRANFEGLLPIEHLPSALFVVDINYEMIAVREARKVGIPIVAIADTNADPTLVDFPIPANDDSARSIRILLVDIFSAIRRGLEEKELRCSKGNTGAISREDIEWEPEITLTASAAAAVDGMEKSGEVPE